MKTVMFRKNTDLDFLSNESFKTLRTNLMFCGEQVKVILFTSSVPNEGKSSVVFQLAKSFAEDGKRLLLLDADIRKSVLAGYCQVDGETRGLSHYLSGQEAMEQVIYHTDLENFDIIFAGPVCPNPAELLGNEKLEQLVARQRENYDYILIDTPPLGSVIDAAVAARVCDGAVMVVKGGQISYKLAQKAKAQLERTGCRILGVVLNQVPKEDNRYYGKYYKYGYGYGEMEGKKKNPSILKHFLTGR